MAHRTGSGQKITDIGQACRDWRAANRTVTTYPNKGEWNAWTEDFGELVERAADGTEVRRHATLKCTARGGSPKIVHNCVIIGNPAAYERWKADQRPELEKGWYPQRSWHADKDLDEVLEMLREGTRRRPVSVRCLETGAAIPPP